MSLETLEGKSRKQRAECKVRDVGATVRIEIDAVHFCDTIILIIIIIIYIN